MNDVSVVSAPVGVLLSDAGRDALVMTVFAVHGWSATTATAWRQVDPVVFEAMVGVDGAPSDVELNFACPDGMVEVTGSVEDGFLTLRLVAALEGRSQAPKPVRSVGELSPVSRDDATRFIEFLCETWLSLTMSSMFRRRDAFGRPSGELQILPPLAELGWQVASELGRSAIGYLSDLPDGALIALMPVQDSGCEAFIRFASSVRFDGMEVARLENPMSETETGDNFFIFVVSSTSSAS